MKNTPDYEISYLSGQGELVEKLNRFLNHLKTLEKSKSTLYTYGKDLEIFRDHFGPDKSIQKITKPLMGAFLKCDGIKKTASGRMKSNITITKTRRVVGQFLDWLVAVNDIESSPMPKRS